MNLFSILIPFLLSMAVFQKMAIVEVFMEQQSVLPQFPVPVETQNLNLTLALTDDSFQVWARGGALPKIYTKEIVEVRCKSDNKSHRHDRSIEKEIKCLDGKVANQFDYERLLVLMLKRESEEDPGSLVEVFRNPNDSALIDSNRDFVLSSSDLKMGNVYGTLDEDVHFRLDSQNKSQIKKDYLTAYDELSLLLNNLQSRFVDSPDSEKIIILSDDKIEFDKIMQAMDAARKSGFHKIELAKMSS